MSLELWLCRCKVWIFDNYVHPPDIPWIYHRYSWPWCKLFIFLPWSTHTLYVSSYDETRKCSCSFQCHIYIFKCEVSVVVLRLDWFWLIALSSAFRLVCRFCWCYNVDEFRVGMHREKSAWNFLSSSMLRSWNGYDL